MKKSACILLLCVVIISLVGCNSAEPTIQYIEKEVPVQQCCGNEGVEYAPVDNINVAIICKACGRELGELPMAIIEKEIIVEKEIIKEVPIETIIEKEVIKEVPTEVIIEKEIIVEKEIIKEIEKPVEVIIEKEVEIIVEKEIIVEIEKMPEINYWSYQACQNMKIGDIITNIATDGNCVTDKNGEPIWVNIINGSPFFTTAGRKLVQFYVAPGVALPYDAVLVTGSITGYGIEKNGNYAIYIQLDNYKTWEEVVFQ